MPERRLRRGLAPFPDGSTPPGAPARPSSPAWRRNTASRTAPPPTARWPEGHSCCCSWKPLNLARGTGSKPDEPPSQVMGWQRDSRRAVSHRPLTGPCVCKRLQRIGRAGGREAADLAAISGEMNGAIDADRRGQAARRHASVRMLTPSPAFASSLRVRRFQGRGDVGQKGRKGPRHGGAARDQNIVMARASQKGQHLRRSGAQAALGAVAGHRIADLAAGGEADAQLCLAQVSGVAQVSRVMAPSTRRIPRAARRKSARFFRRSTWSRGVRLSRPGRPPGVQAESFLRPRARRRVRTLRPPAVAMRERKPWRRLRTSLLG